MVGATGELFDYTAAGGSLYVLRCRRVDLDAGHDQD
jgi:hypothetical protein